MKATNWEFANRALVFGVIFGCSFALYALDRQSGAAVLANWLESILHVDAGLAVRALFGLAAFVLALAALLRTWASSYLQAGVVYATEVKTESLVAGGPYRRVRNPLYLATILMAFGMGALMNRAGFVFAVVAMTLFCYRLILREESDLAASHGPAYEQYRRAVPRLWPALRPRIASSGRPAHWSAGFKAEFWCWGCAAAVAALAVTLSVNWFYLILAASIALLWLTSLMLRRG
ncbi:MAG TPA: isoprenylcysteine carboxylmethyltransferase family protein [Bryobacteraceae bacterium]|nr:isoprenylcysteine carboxylmethyltransferase family protein [Bryobacteraceae bacterium]